ncbi:MAG: glycine cleavage system protein GcvH [Lentisphaeria bacterium]|nr:glycine cleavage system protein GcvH [Lentisphaeria bacterium]
MKYYSEDHEWVELIGDEAVIGISEYAAETLGEVTYVELPGEDDDFIIGDTLGVVESDDASVDIYAPISGTIIAVNDALEDEPGLISDSPEEKGWLCRLGDIDSSELDDMMNEDAYLKYVSTLEDRCGSLLKRCYV